MEESDVKLTAYWRVKAEQDIEQYAMFLKIPQKHRRKFTNAISTITLNVSNGMRFSEAIDEAVEFICSRFPSEEVSPDKIRDILLLRESRNIPKEGKIRIGQVKKMWFQRFDKKDVHDLKQRYNFICPNTPFFWAIHPSFFWCFLDRSPIEGFASPFNFSSKRWCSRYEEDKVFGSMGNFFNVIDQVESTLGELWIINPPYTRFIFDKVLEAVKRRRERYPNDEFIFMTPVWEDVGLIEYIKEEGTTFFLEKGKYRIYDYSVERELSPPVDMMIGYIGKNKKAIKIAVKFLMVKNSRNSSR